MTPSNTARPKSRFSKAITLSRLGLSGENSDNITIVARPDIHKEVAIRTTSTLVKRGEFNKRGILLNLDLV